MRRTVLALFLVAAAARGQDVRASPGPDGEARSTAPRAADARSPIARGFAALGAWDLEAAQAAADEADRKAAASPEALYLRGRVLFEAGRYAEAAQKLAAAIAAGADFDAARDDLRLAQAAQKETEGDVLAESAHFALRTRPGKDELLAPYLLEALEKAHAALTAELGVAPQHKIRVEVYEDAEALSRVSPLTAAEIKTTGTIALCKYGRLMLTTPRALLRGYPWLDTVTHEYVHLLVSLAGRGEVPVWLQEGLAKFLETRWRGPPGRAMDAESLRRLAAAAREGRLVPFARMHPSIAKLATQEEAALAFAEVEQAVRLLYGSGGPQALARLTAAMARGANDEAAVVQAYGHPFAQFEAAWKAACAHPAFDQARTPRQQKLVFREGKARPAGARDPSAGEGGSAERGEPADPEAGRAARLGDLLMQRGRFLAAEKEYRRARTHGAADEPVLARRFAFAALQSGHAGEARAALATAVSQEPEDEAAQVLYARVLLDGKEPGRAKAALDAGLAIDPFDPALHAVYVDVSRAMGDKALEARELRALSLSRGQVQR